MTVQIPWTKGSGNIILTFTGQGNGTIVVTSDDNNLDEERSQVLTVSGGGLSRQMTVIQGMRTKSVDDYLTFTALENGTFTLKIGEHVNTDSLASVSYSLDNGVTWVTTDNVDYSTVTITTPTVTVGSTVKWKGIGAAYATNSMEYTSSSFSATGRFSVSGNIMSLLFGDNYEEESEISNNFAFCNLFENSKVTDAGKLLLPATTLTNYCYYYMFRDCTSLTTAPELPATALAIACYNNMFSGCTSLTNAPKLLATTLTTYCYYNMFYGCTKLRSVTCLATNIPATGCTNNWLFNVAATGTFTKVAGVTWPTGTSGIPSGWTVVEV